MAIGDASILLVSLFLPLIKEGVSHHIFDLDGLCRARGHTDLLLSQA